MTPTDNSSLWSQEDSHPVFLSSAEGTCSAKCTSLSSVSIKPLLGFTSGSLLRCFKKRGYWDGVLSQKCRHAVIKCRFSWPKSWPTSTAGVTCSRHQTCHVHHHVLSLASGAADRFSLENKLSSKAFEVGVRFVWTGMCFMIFQYSEILPEHLSWSHPACWVR